MRQSAGPGSASNSQSCWKMRTALVSVQSITTSSGVNPLTESCPRPPRRTQVGSRPRLSGRAKLDGFSLTTNKPTPRRWWAVLNFLQALDGIGTDGSHLEFAEIGGISGQKPEERWRETKLFGSASAYDGCVRRRLQRRPPSCRRVLCRPRQNVQLQRGLFSAHLAHRYATHLGCKGTASSSL